MEDHGRRREARQGHIHEGVTEDNFVATRTARDATFEVPRLTLRPVQVNRRGRRFPEAEVDCTSYLKLPLDML